MIPDNITKEHLLIAIREIEETGIRKGRHSSTYNVTYEGKNYPPKLIISIANRFANGEELDGSEFEGGKGTPAFQLLKREGFIIEEKEQFSWVETHQELITFLTGKEEAQIELIELLKSVGIGPFNDKASLGDHDTELNEIDPFTFFCYIYKYGPKKRLELLQKIADKLKIKIPSDEKGIPSAQAQKVWLFPYQYERVNNEVKRLWNFFNKELNGNVSDEDFSDVLQINNIGKTKLTEALFYINPKKYFPINGPTKPYLKETFGIHPKFKTYSEYLEILNKIKSKTNAPFYELSYEAWKWKNQNKQINYWVFQGNPKIFDFETALREDLLKDWTVKAHKDKIKIGDKVILWMTGKNAGCYALAEVTTEAEKKSTSLDDHLWIGENTGEIRAGIKITHNFLEKPILKEIVTNNSKLKKLKAGSQGTNFSATEIEYQTILKLSITENKRKYWLFAPGENASHWEEFYEKGIMGLGWDEIGDLNLLGDKDSITKTIKEKYNTQSKSYNNALANLEFQDKISEGDIIIPKKGRQDYLGYGIVTSGYYYDNSRSSYQKCRKVDWKKKGLWNDPRGNIVLKTLTDISKYPDYKNRLIQLIGIELDQNKKDANISDMNLSLNTILYGPPGTGKTHILKNKYMDYFTTTEATITRDEFIKNIIQDCSWWQVIGLAILDLGKSKVSDISQHEFIMVKTLLSNSSTITPTIWSNLQSHTVEDCEFVKVKRRMSPLIFNKTENSEWEVIEKEMEEQSPELLTLKSDIDNFEKIPKKKIERFEFLTFHQSYSYEDFIEGIKPELSDNDVAYAIEEGVFQKLCNRARNDLGNKYAIFIDEINRGNISAIFGELITLIEEDKRTGEKNEIFATLPYSKKRFSVPANVYIIGTMNTADRSVEALDTALRRRFSFVEMNPDPAQLNTIEFKCTGIDLTKLLLAINGRIEKLLDKDYCIGHSYFMTIKDKQNPLEELKSIFKNKILPLLQEYFYGDWGKILLIIGNQFVEINKDTVKFLSTNSYEEFEEYDEKPIYSFTNPASWTLDSFKSIYE